MVTSPSLQSLVRKAPVTVSFATLFLVLLALRPVEALHVAFILAIVLASRSGVRAGLAGAALAIGLEAALLWTSHGAILSDHSAYVFATWGLFVGSGIISGIVFRHLSALDARFENLTRRREEENGALAELGRIISSSLDVGEINERFADRAEAERLYPGTLPGYDNGLRSFLDAPLIVRDRPVGTVNFRSAVPFLYTERDRNLSERVALQIAGAVANTRLYAELEREAKEREVLAEIGRIVTSSVEIGEVYQRFAERKGSRSLC